MINCEESSIRFSFPLTWDVVKYEDSRMHTCHMMPLQNTNAVDYICYDGNKVWLFEVKNFTSKKFLTENYEKEGKEIKPIEHLLNELTAKIRDTLCGIGMARMLNDRQLVNFSTSLFSNSPACEYPRFVFFCELDEIEGRLNKKEIQMTIAETLKKRFAPLKVQIFVIDSTLNQSKRSWKAEVV